MDLSGLDLLTAPLARHEVRLALMESTMKERTNG